MTPPPSRAVCLVASLLLCACPDDDPPAAPDSKVIDQGATDNALVDGQSKTPDGPAGTDGPPPPDIKQVKDGPVAPDAAVKLPTAAEVLKACIIWGSCIPDDGVNDCMRDYYGKGKEVSAAFPCLAKTKACQGTKACLNVWHVNGPPCGRGMKGSKCSDSKTVVACDDQWAFFWDCKKLFGVGCLKGQCSSGATCTGSGAHCKGKMRMYCKSGVEVFDESCGQYELTCKKGFCAGHGAACTQSACKGDVAHLCVSGHVRTLNCKAFGAGFSCKATATGARCQQAAECDPDASKWKETCEGDKAVLCHAGKKVKVDCKTLGFSSCVKGLCKP